jgi:hypothetical protein
MRDKKAASLINDLKEKMGIVTADRSRARGTSLLNSTGEEMEVITVLVSKDQADEVFEYIFFEAGLNKPHQGLIYQQELLRASRYTLPKEGE